MSIAKYLCLFLPYLGWLLATPALACDLYEGESQPILKLPTRYLAGQPTENHTSQLIKLILKKAEARYGPCEIRLLNQDLPVRRLELYLERGQKLHVVELAMRHERNERFLPVRIPVKKGLIGVRISLIRKGEQARFNTIHTLEDLRTLTAGQGERWADTQVLKVNGLPVATSTTSDVESLINMLATKRFDYFPRGALQLTPEAIIYEKKPIEIDRRMLIRYPHMSLLYVNRNNPSLVARLEHGLFLAYEDGSFDKLFYSRPKTVAAIDRLDIKNRKVFNLCNPLMPKWAPTHIDRYWLLPWPKHLQNNDCRGSAAGAEKINVSRP